MICFYCFVSLTNHYSPLIPLFPIMHYCRPCTNWSLLCHNLSLPSLLLSSAPSSTLSPWEAGRAGSHLTSFPLLLSPVLRRCDILIKPDAPSCLCMCTSSIGFPCASEENCMLACQVALLSLCFCPFSSLTYILYIHTHIHMYIYIYTYLFSFHFCLILLFQMWQKANASWKHLFPQKKILKRGTTGCQVLPTDIKEHLLFERTDRLFSEDHFTPKLLLPRGWDVFIAGWKKPDITLRGVVLCV